MSYESELSGLREVLELPTAGQLRRSGELAELRRLIERYEVEARQMYVEFHGPI